jgi:hypothetical protein
MAWTNLATRVANTDSNAAADINALMEDARLIKGGTAGTAPTKSLETLITEVAAIGSPATDSYSADTSTTQTLVYTSGNITYNPTSDHDVNLPTTSVPAGWTRKYTNRSATKVLTVKASGGNVVCKIIPKTWVIFQSRQATPTAETHWMQVDAGGGWADWGGSASNFPSAGWGSVTLANGKLRVRRSGPNLYWKGYFELGTVGASRAKALIPYGLSADTDELTTQKTKYGNFHQVVSAGPYALWAGGNASGIVFYSSGDGADYVAFGVTTTSWNMVLANVSDIFASSQGCWIELEIPISGWAIG